MTLPFARVLVVEDNPGDAGLVEVALAQSVRPRFHAAFAATMAEAVEHLRDGVGADAILLDLSLPDSFGEDTLLRMRAAAPHLPIVIMTGLDDAQFAERAVALGAQDYLVKGEFSGPMLWWAISYAISRSHMMVERNALVNELRASAEMKNRMLGILAHDLRNPIGAVSGNAEFLEMTERKNLSPQMITSLQANRESAAFMNTLVEEVLTMAVADAREVKVVRHRLDLGEVVRKAVDICAVAAAKKQVELVVDARPVWAEGDAVKLERVLNNLISNAIKFSKPNDPSPCQPSRSRAASNCRFPTMAAA
jgi:sigma-B regulation protein RsbU (phosphoserine phosphatase)